MAQDDYDDDRPRKKKKKKSRGTSTLAMAALLLGVVSIPLQVCGCFTGLPAIFCALLAINAIRNDERIEGTGFAWGGLGLGAVGVLISVGYGVYGYMLFTDFRQKMEGEMRSVEAMEVGSALRAYHRKYKHFPRLEKDPMTGQVVSWRVQILPFLGPQGENLYKQYDLTKPWDHPSNLKLKDQRPEAFAPPPKWKANSDETYLRAVVGPGAGFEAAGELKLGDFKDGPGTTLLAVEAADPVVWIKPDELTVDPSSKLPGFGKRREPGFVVVFASGGVEYLSRKDFPESTLKAMVTRAGGEKPKWPDSFSPDHSPEMDDEPDEDDNTPPPPPRRGGRRFRGPNNE
jgi:hypothetical protein